MSTAVGTGVVALVLEANRNAGIKRRSAAHANLVKAILQHSAIPLHDDHGVAYDVLTQGTGEINAAGAVAIAGAIDTKVAVRRVVAHESDSEFDGDRRPAIHVGQEHRLGRQHRLGRHAVLQAARLDEEHRLGRQHRLG